MARIAQLEAAVVNQIAAGEVIERPASVVKELLENSLDSLATRIEVDVAAGGTEQIRVVDNGEGIDPADLPLAVTSHATSKIRSAGDLFRVHTMGFRGEALASIAEISRLRIRSRNPANREGAELEVNLGAAGPPRPCGCPPGTLVEVRQLFANTPVRRKFLKTPATEFGHVSEQFTRLALAHPRLHLVLRHNGKVVHELPATGQLRERLQMFFGGELADQLIWVEAEQGDCRLWGYAAHPSQSKSTRKGQYLFLNGRWIQDRTAQHALSEAYRGLLMTGRQPIAFLFLEWPNDQVDVNVHPTKVEVRFRDSQRLYRLVLSALRNRFLSMDLGNELQLAGSSAGPAAPPPDQRQLQAEFADWARDQLNNWEMSPAPLVTAVEERPPNRQLADEAPLELGTDVEAGEFPAAEAQPAAALAPEADQVPAAETHTDAARGIGQHAMQVHDCYLVLETEQGLAVIDQHALHERIVYEHLRRRVLAGAVESQRLLVPLTLELSEREASLLLDHAELLSELGLGLEAFGKGTLLLTRYPAMLAKADFGEFVRDVADHLENPERRPTRRDILDDLLHMMSCKAAIKAGHRLSPEEIDALLAQRHLVDDAHHCPHGRPTALTLSRAELDRQFGRLG